MPKIKVDAIPNSWPLSGWEEHAAHVYPNSQVAATNLVRQHRAELIKFGALARVGRNITMLGQGYAQFLASKMGRVEGYDLGGAGLAAANLKRARQREANSGEAA